MGFFQWLIHIKDRGDLIRLSASAFAKTTKPESSLINFIEEADVTLAALSIELERAVIQYEARENSIYVNEDGFFPYWLHVNKGSGLVGLETYITFRESSSELQRMTLANEFNRYSFGITAFVVEDKLRVDHVLNFRDGLLRENFIRVARNFANSITNSIRDHDPNYELLMRLSEISTANGSDHVESGSTS